MFTCQFNFHYVRMPVIYIGNGARSIRMIYSIVKGVDLYQRPAWIINDIQNYPKFDRLNEKRVQKHGNVLTRARSKYFEYQFDCYCRSYNEKH